MNIYLPKLNEILSFCTRQVKLINSNFITRPSKKKKKKNNNNSIMKKIKNEFGNFPGFGQQKLFTDPIKEVIVNFKESSSCRTHLENLLLISV